MQIVKTEKTVEEAQDFIQSENLEAALKHYIAEDIDDLIEISHSSAVSRNWWHNDDGTPKEMNFGERLALIHSEISEAMEGGRKDLQSDHIPGFSMVEEELADALVRIFDLAGGMNLNLGRAYVAKTRFNLVRKDHAPEVRAAEGGKDF